MFWDWLHLLTYLATIQSQPVMKGYQHHSILICTTLSLVSIYITNKARLICIAQFRSNMKRLNTIAWHMARLEASRVKLCLYWQSITLPLAHSVKRRWVALLGLCPKILLAKRGKLGFYSACPIAIFYRIHLHLDTGQAVMLHAVYCERYKISKKNRFAYS